MDEPLSSLDPDLSLHLRGEILRLHAELGFTLVYVTHNREEAADLGSRVIAMRHGKIDGPDMPMAGPTS
jgi:ABC-type sugar transport system ATPase subunit